MVFYSGLMQYPNKSSYNSKDKELFSNDCFNDELWAKMKRDKVKRKERNKNDAITATMAHGIIWHMATNKKAKLAIRVDQ